MGFISPYAISSKIALYHLLTPDGSTKSGCKAFPDNFMKSELSLKKDFGWKVFFNGAKNLFSRFWQKDKTVIATEKQPYPNQEKIYSVDTFNFSHTKWGWIYTYDSLTNSYTVQDVLPFCTRCDVPMQYEGNPFIDAVCLACKQKRRPYHYAVLQSKSKILAEINKKYTTGNYLDLVPESTSVNPYFVSALPR